MYVRVSLLLLCMLCLSATTRAAEPTWTLEQLMSGLATRPTSEKRFTETKTLSMLNEPLLLSGTLSYTAPSHLEKHIRTPYEERYVVDGDILLVENKSKNFQRSFALQSYPEIWAFVESFRATLAGDTQTLRRFYTLQLSGDKQKWELALTPLQPAMLKTIAGIRIKGRADQITSIAIVETSGDQSLMTIEDR